jgi:hypothetical protein
MNLNTISNFISEGSEEMVTLKNFIFLLLSPPQFDSKKYEMIESCIKYPIKGNNNKGNN